MRNEIRYGQYDANKKDDQIISFILAIFALLVFLVAGFVLGLSI